MRAYLLKCDLVHSGFSRTSIPFSAQEGGREISIMGRLTYLWRAHTLAYEYLEGGREYWQERDRMEGVHTTDPFQGSLHPELPAGTPAHDLWEEPADTGALEPKKGGGGGGGGSGGGGGGGGGGGASSSSPPWSSSPGAAEVPQRTADERTTDRHVPAKARPRPRHERSPRTARQWTRLGHERWEPQDILWIAVTSRSARSARHRNS